ncbi:MAG: serine/threonine-protein kinase [Cyanobacteria bacterium J06626_14]
MTLTAGATLQNGRYIVQSICAETAYDMTYRALHTYLGQVVFLKALNVRTQQALKTDSVRHYFNHKVALFAQSRCPNLVSIVDGFEEGGIPYVALLTPDGTPLPDWLQQQHLSSEDAIAHLELLANAIQTLHQSGIFHGQLSDQTVTVDAESQALVLSDISLISFLPDEAIAHTDESFNQRLVQSHDRQRRDIQGLASISHALLTGSTLQLNHVDGHDEAAQSRENSHQLPSDVVQMIEKGLNPDSDETISNWFQALVLAILSARDHSWLPQDWGDPSSMPLPPSFNHSNHSSADETTGLTFQETTRIQTAQTKIVSAPITSTSKHTSQGRSPKASSKKRWLVPTILGTSSIVAASFGGYVGLSLRLQEPEQLERSPIFGQELFGSEQAFPESDDWPGTSSFGIDTSRFLFEDLRPQSFQDTLSDDALLPSDIDPNVETFQTDYGLTDDVQVGADFDGSAESTTDSRIKDEIEYSTDTLPDILTAPASPSEADEPIVEEPNKLILEPPPSDTEGWPSLLNDASAADDSDNPPISSVEM